jgi:hypothetical protein
MPGTGVELITLESLVKGEALADVGAGEGVFHCSQKGCQVAYFQNERGLVIEVDAVTVVIGTKATMGPRPLCYCFDHSVESIEGEFERTGTSTASATIGELCRKGEDQCETKNPQGFCCLGNVRKAEKAARARRLKA